MSNLGTATFIADQRSGSVGLPPSAQPRAWSIEDPQFPLSDPVIWSDGWTSSSGSRVSPLKALHLPAVYQAVTRIASDVARCPLELYEEQDGAWSALKDDPLFRLTSIQPNREMDPFKFWSRVMVQRLVWQNAYIFVAYNAMGQPAELLPLLSDRTEPRRENGVLYYVTEVNGREVPMPASRVMHLEGIGFDNLAALDLTRLMRDAWGLALAQIDFAAKVFKAGGRRGGVLQIPAGQTKTAADRLEEGFRRKYEDQGSWFTTVVLRDNATFHEAQMTLRDSQSMEGREESARDVARAFNMRPGHVGVETSGVYGNKSDDTRDYLDMTLRPHMTGIAMQARVKLLPLDRQASQCFEHNTDDLLQMSVAEQFAAYGAGVAALIITSNEARGKLGFPAHPDGDKLQNPHTQAAAKPESTDTTPDTQPARSSDTEELDDDDEPLNRAHRELLEATVAGVVAVIGEKAVRASASAAKFCAWLDTRFPQERTAIARAIGPVARCLAARRGEEAKQLTDQLAAKTFGRLSHDLQSLASTKTESELKAAVTTYFTNWSNAPCNDTPKQAA